MGLKYRDELHEKLLRPKGIDIISVQVIILAEQPELKPYFHQMQQEVATQLGIETYRVSIQGKTFEGKGVIGQQQGIEVQATITIISRQQLTPQRCTIQLQTYSCKPCFIERVEGRCQFFYWVRHWATLRLFIHQILCPIFISTESWCHRPAYRFSVSLIPT